MGIFMIIKQSGWVRSNMTKSPAAAWMWFRMCGGMVTATLWPALKSLRVLGIRVTGEKVRCKGAGKGAEHKDVAVEDYGG
jgi:hypothetical protein